MRYFDSLDWIVSRFGDPSLIGCGEWLELDVELCGAFLHITSPGQKALARRKLLAPNLREERELTTEERGKGNVKRRCKEMVLRWIRRRERPCGEEERGKKA
jgi:hypothetical protein